MAVAVGHANVAHEHVGAGVSLERRCQRVGDAHRGAVGLEHRAHEIGGVGMVLGDEHAHADQHLAAGGGGGRGRPAAAAAAGAAGQRQPHREGRALAPAGARGAHRAGVQLGEVTHDRQPQAEAPVATRDRAVGLPEAVEDARQDLGLDPDAGVGQRQHRELAVARQPDANVAALRRELHGVGDEVGGDLTQAQRVAEHEAGAGIDEQLELHALALGLGARQLDGLLEDGRQVDRKELELELAGHDARDVQQVVDELRLGPGVSLDHLERLGRLVAGELPATQ